MAVQFYQPAETITGPAYSPWFKLLATVVTVALAGYGISFALRFPLADYRWPVLVLLGAAFVLLLVSYVGFLHSTVTIDATGIKQTWLINRQAQWPDVRSAKMIGLPRLGWAAPPRLVVRTGTGYYTFNAGTEALLAEFARISLAYQMKR